MFVSFRLNLPVWIFSISSHIPPEFREPLRWHRSRVQVRGGLTIVTIATTVHILPAPCTIPGTVRGHSSKTGGAFVIVNNYCAFKTPGSEIDNKYQPGHFIWLDTYLLPTYLDEFQRFKRDYHFGSSMVLTQMITPTINIHLQKICTIYLNLIRFLKPSHCHLYKSQCNGNHVAMAYGCLD